MWFGIYPICRNARFFGHSFKTSALEAAFLNAIMANSIDFCEGHKCMSSKGFGQIRH